MEKPILYCYRLNEETGKLECYTIEEYKIYDLGPFTDRKEIRFDARLTGLKTKSIYYLKLENIDRFVRGCVFTYEENYAKVYELIKLSLLEQIESTISKLKKLQNLYAKLSWGGYYEHG